MKTMTKAEKRACGKEMTIARILKNDTYSDQSGLFNNLRTALRKMSYSDLQALEIIIGCKERSPTCSSCNRNLTADGKCHYCGV